jgi:hypothetical protein
MDVRSWNWSCFCQKAWMRSLSRSLGVCLIRAVELRSFRILELRSPRAYRRFSSAVSTINGFTATGLQSCQSMSDYIRRTAYFFVPGSRDTMVNAQLSSMSSFLIFSPSLGAFATCIEISKLLLPVAYVTCPDNSKSHISVSGWLITIRSQDAVTVVTSSPVCLYLCELLDETSRTA